jgi:hypothetical protein
MLAKMIEPMIQMLCDYEDRLVAREDINPATFVMTVKVYDGALPYETGVKHPEYNGGRVVGVEAYATREEAEVGHAKWVGIMKSDSLPDELVECCNAEIMQLYDVIETLHGNPGWKRYKRVRLN